MTQQRKTLNNFEMVHKIKGAIDHLWKRMPKQASAFLLETPLN
eukprot:CAMPEP_0202011784 /NCGR_PEP_ID=MMETSP0905-20130828/21210_1 /ASSEMBLY_ACC=CAM_ASM_000554 /TAXON_ID=420261 /ORGANISM="Thalassiosira antarctica, Strain CCMP982" /LENGTH=42 /DNA_ID= /DNA_START= /DNA_END= /DNA_ORIENTATION=